MRLTRRGLLLGGVAGVVAVTGGVEAGVVPGRARVHGALGLTGDDGVVPDVAPGLVESGRFESAARRTSVGWTVMYPQSQKAQLPVALVLHGRGGDHTSAVNDLGADRYLADAVRAGVAPFALASVDGGDNYWHKRASGDDPQRMLTEEFLPLLAKRGLRTSRYGVLGWSMGGYGALLLATETESVAAVGAMSPALWRKASDASAGAFDNDADFRAHQVFGRAFKEVALRIDCGRDDPFAGAVREFRDEVDAEGGIQPGAHTAGYWRRTLPGQLAFLGAKLHV